MTDEDKYRELIALTSKFNEDVDGSMTHLNRAKRVISEIADTNYKLAVSISKNSAFLPPEEFNQIKEYAIKMTNSMDEFADFLKDYGEDLVSIGNGVVNMFEEFKAVMGKEK